MKEIKREIKKLNRKLDIEYKKFHNRIDTYDREKRQLRNIQRNFENIQKILNELMENIEKLRKRTNIIKY